jgi:hypothetical protein
VSTVLDGGVGSPLSKADALQGPSSRIRLVSCS